MPIRGENTSPRQNSSNVCTNCQLGRSRQPHHHQQLHHGHHHLDQHRALVIHITGADAICETTVLFRASPSRSSPAPSCTILRPRPPTKTFLTPPTIQILDQPLLPTFRQENLPPSLPFPSPLLRRRAPQGEVELRTDPP